jgi:hypothetical protein
MYQAAVYRDVDQSLTKNAVYNADAVIQSIRNILMTRKGTRVFNSEFGSNLNDILFDFADPATELRVYAEVIEAVTRWEPRAILDRVKTTVTMEPDNHICWVNLVFSLVGIPGQEYNHEIGFKI